MDCQNLNSLRHSETRRRQALFLRIAALCLGSAATGVLFLPVFHGVFNNLSYSLNGYQLLTASLRVNDSVIPLPPFAAASPRGRACRLHRWRGVARAEKSLGSRRRLCGGGALRRHAALRQRLLTGARSSCGCG